MKTFVLYLIAIMAISKSALSQTNPSPYPCLKTFEVSNLGNPPGCPATLDGYIKTGLITVSFTASVPVSIGAPTIISFYYVDENGNLTAIDAKLYFRGFTKGTFVAEYCFYTATGENVISNGAHAKYKALIQYPGYDAATCDVINAPPPVILPVNFKSFTASRANSANSLKWTTASESNNKGFYVQRFFNGQWENLIFIASKAEGGNSGADLNYTYNDVFNFKGVVQYRILQVDLDGQSKYSQVRSVSNGSASASILVYPNPASVNGSISIVFSDVNTLFDVQVLDNSGRLVKEYNAVRSTQQVSGLAKGQYLARVKDSTSGLVSVEKFIVQ